MKPKFKIASLILSIFMLLTVFTLASPILAANAPETEVTKVETTETTEATAKDDLDKGKKEDKPDLVERIVTPFVDFLQKHNIPKEVIPFIISLFPVLEIRGGMIAALILEIDFIPAFITCYIGNMLPIPFILLFIRKIFELMRKSKFLSKIVDKLEARAEKKKGTVTKYKEWGLLFFVAIPLPGTGGWTGALIAALMDLRMKKCLPIIALGVLIAGMIMSLVTYGIF